MDIETVLALVHLALTLWLVFAYFSQCGTEQELREEIARLNEDRERQVLRAHQLLDYLNDALEVKQHELLNQQRRNAV